MTDQQSREPLLEKEKEPPLPASPDKEIIDKDNKE